MSDRQNNGIAAMRVRSSRILPVQATRPSGTRRESGQFGFRDVDEHAQDASRQQVTATSHALGFRVLCGERLNAICEVPRVRGRKRRQTTHPL
mgnify:CR=1 FL=1